MSRTRNLRGGIAGLFACLIALGGACGDDKAADDGHGHGDHGDGEHSHGDEPIGTPTEAECPDDSPPTYASFGQKFMEDYCLRCHSKEVTGAARNDAPGDHNFDTQGEIALLIEHIDQYAGSGPAITNRNMPPSAPFPSDEERAKLSEWLACGAL
ncbi:MAG: c-type cytochrome [Polyangiales bacterium]